MNNSRRLKELLARRAAVTVPGAANALFARVIEELGFEAVYVTGAGIANMLLGVPDVGLTTMTEVRDTVAAIADAVSIPIIVDADTGYGNAVNVVRTVGALERAGAAGVQIEDQAFPKKCGHFAGKDVIAAEEMVQKVSASAQWQTPAAGCRCLEESSVARRRSTRRSPAGDRDCTSIAARICRRRAYSSGTDTAA